MYHQLHGPAIEWHDGDAWWYQHGPAVVPKLGNMPGHYLKGTFYTEQGYWKQMHARFAERYTVTNPDVSCIIP